MIDYILGDLHEEFRLLRVERGAGRARLWYMRQLLLSLPVLVKPANILRPMAIALPLLLLDRLWCFLYSLIPLKDGLDRAPGFLVANIVALCICTAIARTSALIAVLATAFALTFAVSVEPTGYICIALLSVGLTARLRRSYEVA